MHNPNHCEVCKKKFQQKDLFPLELVHDALLENIKNDIKDMDEKGYICLVDLEKYQLQRSRELLKIEVGDLNEAEEEVLASIKSKEILAENINAEYETQLTFGQRLADHISSFGGSWNFISIFFALLVFWMFLNTWFLYTNAYDPYPYILLNLILSCLAAIQAPIIMMSQNRQSHRDRLTAENDYKVNLKSEILILQLTAKFDHLMKKQWLRMLEHQQMQIEISQAVLNLQHKLDAKVPPIKKAKPTK